jgi:hypothetical protein
MSMDGIILAHAGGLDEMAMLLFPIVVGGGVWLMTRQKPKPNPEGGLESGEVRNIREARQPPPPRQKWGGKKP